MKLVFMGTPDFAVPALQKLVQAGHEIVAVYTQPPRPAGRGQKEKKSPVHLAADEHGIEVRTPKSLRQEDEQKKFASLDAQKAVVAAYGLILPKAILDARLCINIHASLLPRWRGAAPIQRAILAGDDKSGITIMQMDEGLDTGDMLIWDEVPITDGTNASDLHDALSEMGGDLIVKYLANADEIKPIKQDDNTTYADKIDKSEALLGWNENATQIDRKIRAFNPFPGAYFTYNNEKIKILAADCEQSKHEHAPGQVVDDKLSIACQDGIVHPKVVQRQGKKVMPIADMLRGYIIPTNTRISQ